MTLAIHPRMSWVKVGTWTLKRMRAPVVSTGTPSQDRLLPLHLLEKIQWVSDRAENTPRNRSSRLLGEFRWHKSPWDCISLFVTLVWPTWFTTLGDRCGHLLVSLFMALLQKTKGWAHTLNVGGVSLTGWGPEQSEKEHRRKAVRQAWYPFLLLGHQALNCCVLPLSLYHGRLAPREPNIEQNKCFLSCCLSDAWSLG